MTHNRLVPKFVEFIPDQLDAGQIYVSMEYAVAVHLCACGCGRKTVTPLSPADWRLTFDGRNVTLRPSIGNWSYPCRSHYWITDGSVRWASDMTEGEVASMRDHARHTKSAMHAAERRVETSVQAAPVVRPQAKPSVPKTVAAKVRSLFNWLRSDT